MGEPDWNLDWITPDLAVGGSFGRAQIVALTVDHGVGAVIDCREEACDDEAAMQRHGVAFLHLPTPDMKGVAVRDLDRGVSFARQAWVERRRLLVHCQHGIGRSAMTALCIMIDRGVQPMAALHAMKAARSCISPSPEQYRGWADWLAGKGLEAPGFDAFAAVAYSHLRQAG